MLTAPFFCSIVLALILGYQWVRYYWLTKHINHKFFPGPKGSFWTGNLRDVPTSRGWLTYTAWRMIYGDLIHLRVFGQHIVVLNSYEDAVELLEKRSKNYSGRSHIPVFETMGWYYNTAFIDYNDRWRLHRKIHQQVLNAQNAISYQPIQRAKISTMLKQLLHVPEKFMDHYRDLAGAIIMKVIYDIDVKPPNDFYISIADTAIANMGKAILPGATLLNVIPILRHVPAWFPGATMKRFCLETLEITMQMINAPFDDVSKRNPDPSSSVAMMLVADNQGKGAKAIAESDLRDACATIYAGGADTVVSSVGSFFLAMVLYPEVQAKAQREIDDIIGNSRLPDYGDRASLPYMEAMYREVLRWMPVTPQAVPHAAVDDDVYKGYFIPKGATVIPNTWAMSRDENRYPDPEVFRPERFIKKNGELNDDMVEYAFGFGRRICPGRFMASHTVWLAITSILATFNIRKAKDVNGKDIPVSREYSDALLIHPLPFECSITPRSSASARLIDNE